MTWVLILIGLSGGANNVGALYSVPGFANQRACEAAGMVVQARTSSVRFACVEVPR